jgi:Na+/H+ antiporter NhaC
MEAIEREPVSVGNWLLTYLIMAIPLVGVVMLFVWAFSSSTHPSKANWAKAALLLFAIMIGLVIVVAVVAGLIGAFAGDLQPSTY